jgi:hypothetical protein
MHLYLKYESHNSFRSKDIAQASVQQKRALKIVCMCSLLNYSEHCRSEASAREQSRLLALLNRPLVRVFQN